MSVNKVQIIGNLGRAPEVRYSQGGTAIASMSVAVGERVKEAGEWKDHTEWFRVVTFGKSAEACAQHLDKGSQVYVEGKLRQRKYNDKAGVEKLAVEVVADDVRFLGGKGGGAPKAPQVSEGAGTGVPVVDDDLPF